ncbi:MAG TPA: hypothetical protein VK631_08475 [Solirubrobacteraceae bacterium]|nr:hypothetical protein [Solirubrobacteraceae bacterium]
MHRTTYAVTVLSEDPIPDTLDLAEVLGEADTGAYVATYNVTAVDVLTREQMAEALTAAGSEPGFFQI